MKKHLLYLTIITTLFSCNNSNQTQTTDNSTKPAETKVFVPVFNADSAYNNLKTQVDFGPRIPGSKSHQECVDFIQQKLKQYGINITVQTAAATTFDAKKFTITNIIGSYKPEFQKRILLLTHYDCRPFADEDDHDKEKPIDGADDAASGVAVLLELARNVAAKNPNTGVDFFFSDLEDYGQNNDSKLPKMEDSWCLGTQYWANNPHTPGYTANYGILLDMVGAKGAVFPREGTGTYFAPDIVEKIWNAAQRIGYGAYFINDKMGNTTDDHLYVNKITKIPCIDIVHMDPETGTYGTYHHTHRDNIDLIDKTTLKVVGQTVLEVIFNE